MGNRFASGKWAISQCDRCDFRYPLKDLRKLVIKTKNINMLVCPTCWDPDQPQLQLGMYPVDDPQGLRDPRPDRSYTQSGYSGLQIDVINPPNPTDEDAFGFPEGGSRIIQWGWNPVGGPQDDGLTPNNLVAQGSVGSVSVTTT
jgi:hypothetical protein